MKRQIVFLLGAGASVKAGIPPMVRFTKEFRSEISCDANLSELVGTLDSVTDYWIAQSRSEPDLEVLYELLYVINRPQAAPQNPLARIPPIPKGRHTELIEYHLKSYIQRRCLAVNPGKVDYLRPLLRFMDLTPDLCIGSLNYDVCIEVFAAANKVPCITGFDAVSGEWKPKLFSLSRSSSATIRLLKMHGSVTWFEVRPGMYESLSPDLSREERVLFKSARGRILERMLIYPGRSKLPLFGPYLKMIEAFRAALLECRLCIVVGYRFADAHLRTLFAEAMSINQDLTLLLVSPQATEIAEDLIGSLGSSDGSRVLATEKKYGYFERALRRDWLYSHAVSLLTSPRSQRRTAVNRSPTNDRELLVDEKLSGIALSSDGTIYATARQKTEGRVLRIDPTNNSAEIICADLGRPRGILVDDLTQSVLVVDNEIKTFGREPKSIENIEGLGRVWRVDCNTGAARPILSLGDCNSPMLRLLTRRSRADLRAACPALLSWPVALTFTSPKTIVVTEARSLVAVDLESQAIERFTPFSLPFNVCDVKNLSVRRLIVLDAGVTDREIGTGRLFYVNKKTRTSKLIAQFGPLATSFALSQDKRSVYVSHNLPKPRGYVSQIDLKSGRRIAAWDGFDGAGTIVLASVSMLLVSTKQGLWAVNLR